MVGAADSASDDGGVTLVGAARRPSKAGARASTVAGSRVMVGATVPISGEGVVTVGNVK